MTSDKTTIELLEELRAKRWSDAAIAKELGVTGVAVWRWRHSQRGIVMERLVRRALEELLERP